MTTRLFHTVVPIPECCGQQMRLCGNMNLHSVRYECSRCFADLLVEVKFTEKPVAELSPKERDATDATP